VSNLHLSSKNQLREFNAKIEQEKITVYRRHEAMYENVRGKILTTALQLVQMQLMAARPRKKCSGNFHSVHGIICGHTLENKVAVGGKLEMDDFDRQWWLADEAPEEIPPIESELARIRDIAAFGTNTANTLLLELRGVGSSVDILDPNTAHQRSSQRSIESKYKEGTLWI